MPTPKSPEITTTDEKITYLMHQVHELTSILREILTQKVNTPMQNYLKNNDAGLETEGLNEFIDINEAMRVLQVASRQQVYNIVNSGAISKGRNGKKSYFRRSECIAYVQKSMIFFKK
jgi:hypothetical protein